MCEENKAVVVKLNEEANETDTLRRQFFKTALEKYGVTEDTIKKEYRYIGSDGGLSEDNDIVKKHCVGHLKQLEDYKQEHVKKHKEELMLPPKMDACLCGQLIKENCYLMHKTEVYPILVSGNCCILKFIPVNNRQKRYCKNCEAPHRNRSADNLCTKCRESCLVCKQPGTYKKDKPTYCSRHAPYWNGLNWVYRICAWKSVLCIIVQQSSTPKYSAILSQESVRVISTKINEILQKTGQVCASIEKDVIQLTCLKKKALQVGGCYCFKRLSLSFTQNIGHLEPFWLVGKDEVVRMRATFEPPALLKERYTEVRAEVEKKEAALALERQRAQQLSAVETLLKAQCLLVSCQGQSLLVNRSLCVYHLMVMMRIRFRVGFLSDFFLFVKGQQNVPLDPELTLVDTITKHHRGGALFVTFTTTPPVVIDVDDNDASAVDTVPPQHPPVVIDVDDDDNVAAQEPTPQEPTPQEPTSRASLFQDLKPFSEWVPETPVKPRIGWDLLFCCSSYRTKLLERQDGQCFRIDLNEEEVIYIAKVLFERGIFYGEQLVSTMKLVGNKFKGSFVLKVENDRFHCESFVTHSFRQVEVYYKKLVKSHILFVSTGWITRLGRFSSTIDDSPPAKRIRLY